MFDGIRSSLVIHPDSRIISFVESFIDPSNLHTVVDLYNGPEKVGGAGKSTQKNPLGRCCYERFLDFVRGARLVQQIMREYRSNDLQT